MFGTFRPCLKQLAPTDRTAFTSIYCDTCGALSAGYGLKSRAMLVHDLITLAWLLTNEHEASSARFPTRNCLKGGIFPYLRRLGSAQQRLLSALSAFTAGVKIDDDVRDQNSARARAMHAVFRSAVQRSRQDLDQLGFDTAQLQEALELQVQVEQRNSFRLDLSSEPSGKAYGAVAKALAMVEGIEDVTVAEEVGSFAGRSVFLIDAWNDLEADRKQGAYNPFLAAGTPDKKSAATQLLTYLDGEHAKFASLLPRLGEGFERRWSHM